MRDIKLPNVGLELARLLITRHKFVCFGVTSHVDINCAKSSLCRLLTAKSRSARGASHHPAFTVSCLTISQKRLSCPPCGTIGGSGKV